LFASLRFAVHGTSEEWEAAMKPGAKGVSIKKVPATPEEKKANKKRSSISADKRSTPKSGKKAKGH
jgi:hypothetical protein